MVSKINKFGLSRYIPSDVRRKIRSDAGYGCVICGGLFVDYEHIEPEFSKAVEHDPDKMTLLCSLCHDKVTKKIFSKKKVWAAKANPKTKQEGFTRDVLDPENTPRTVYIGSSQISMQTVLLIVHNKPVLWFSESKDPTSPYELNFIFHDKNSNVAGFVNKNVFTGVLVENDISTQGYTIQVKKSRKIFVEIKAKGGEPLRINKLNSQYGNAKVSLTGNGDLILGREKYERLTVIDNGCVGIQFHGVPVTHVTRMRMRINKHFVAVQLALRKNNSIINYRGIDVGWFFDNTVITKDYLIAGFVGERGQDIVASVIGDSPNDLIGKLVKTKINNREHGWVIVVKDEESEIGEPIWVSPKDKSTMNSRTFLGYDVSYRILANFGDH
ncbi:HNH endonuclease [Klebsiella aerogenes]